MRFTVSQSALSDAIAVVMKGIASASTLPILSGVLFARLTEPLNSKPPTTPSRFAIASQHA